MEEEGLLHVEPTCAEKDRHAKTNTALRLSSPAMYVYTRRMQYHLIHSSEVKCIWSDANSARPVKFK
jgi:hypothetical protein